MCRLKITILYNPVHAELHQKSKERKYTRGGIKAMKRMAEQATEIEIVKMELINKKQINAKSECSAKRLKGFLVKRGCKTAVGNIS